MRILVAVLGLALGIIAGISLLLVNPLSWLGGPTALPEDLAPPKAYRLDDFRGMEVGALDLLGLGGRKRAVALMDPALALVRVGIVVLPAGQGMPAALAVKVSTIAEANSLWRAQLGTNDVWNIMWPGDGSVFAAGYSNFWTLARDSFFAALRGGGRDLLAESYVLSAAPPQDSATGVTGAAGRYAGFTGEIREAIYPGDKGPDWTLAIKANPPPVNAR